MRDLVFSVESHQFLDWVNLNLHREIATRLRADAGAVIERARQNIQRWKPAHAGTISESALAEWENLLATKSPEELIAIITEDSDEGQRLRQSTPFTGILTQAERDELWRRCEERLVS
jgi:hypothetical protein